MIRAFVLAGLLLLAAPWAAGLDDGRAQTPPMGWRGWTVYWGHPTQDEMHKTMDALVKKREGGLSIADLGFRDVGLDDGWQACGAGLYGGFHDASGRPLVNRTVFPDLLGMTRYGHSKGLNVSWYLNNCNCAEKLYQDGRQIATHYQGDIASILEYEFDGVKLDGCGQFLDLGLWSMLLQMSGRSVIIENCHWGGDHPYFDQDTGDFVCPYHFYRSGGDIQADFATAVLNLQSMRRFLDWEVPLSRPGCWAYPDMLQVGKLGSYEADRTHFSAWAITSSPLVLSFNVTNDTLVSKVWPIISNQEVLDVNQQWAGHPGALVRSEMRTAGRTFVAALPCNVSDPAQRGWAWQATSSGYRILSRSGLCVDTSIKRPLLLMPCNASSPQQAFQLGVNNTLEQTQAGGDHCCLDIFGKVGPLMQCTNCFGVTALNQRFNLWGDMWRDLGSMEKGDMGPSSDPAYPARCMAEVADTVRLPSTFIDPNDILWQVWAKPLPRSRVAVLVMNVAKEGLVANIDLHGLPFAMNFSSVRVRDLYQHKDLGVFVKSISTGPIAVRDSCLLLLSPEPTPTVQYA